MNTQSVHIPMDKVRLNGDLAVPLAARALVLFAHGSGSSRFSSRNQFVATQLNRAGLATLLFDLLTEQEEYEERDSQQHRFDIAMLAERLVAATDWAGQHSILGNFPVGYFGASTGGGAALVAAVQRPDKVLAVVSRGGRPDLAGDALAAVRAPTLLIVGGNDDVVIRLNSEAYGHLRCVKRMEIVPGASHLFEEPGALNAVAGLATEWFTQHLAVTVALLSETAQWTQRNL